MGPSLSGQALRDYDRDGILFPVAVLSNHEVKQYSDALSNLIDTYFGGSFRRIDNLHLFFNWAYKLATHEQLVDAVESIIGDDILIYATLIFSKPPRDSSYVSWHQDSAYSNLHLTPSVSAWIALGDSNAETGCVRAILGSHTLGPLDHVNDNNKSNLLQRGERVDIEVDDPRAADIILGPGEASLHQSNLIHGSNPNSTDHPRTGFIVRFVTSQFSCPPGLSLMRVRGSSECPHANLATPPEEVEQAVAFQAWQDFPGSSGG